MQARKLISVALASLCVLGGLFVTSAISATAAGTHKYLYQFGEVPAEGPLHEHIPLPGPLRDLFSMTVDSGQIWIPDQVTDNSGESLGYRIDKFNAASGEFISQPIHGGPSGPDYFSVAVGHATGQAAVYVAEYASETGSSAIGVYDEAGQKQTAWTGAGTPATSFGPGALQDVAVDNSTGLDWAAGDVYVPDAAQRVVDVFHPEIDGEERYVTQLTGTGTSPGEEFKIPFQVAVNDANGDVIVNDDSKLDVFEPTILGRYAFVGNLAPSGVPSFHAERINAEDGQGDVYATGSVQEGANVSYRVFEFGPAGESLGWVTPETAPGGTFGGEGHVPASVAADPATHDVLVGTSGAELPNPVLAFGPNLVIPDVRTDPATNVKPTSATLDGAVFDPDMAGAATCRFDWGTSAAFGQVAPCQPEAIAPGGSPVAVLANLSGLQPDTTYYYRLRASNANGANPGEPSQDQEFTTAGPGIHGTSAADVAATSATLDASINPHGAPASYYFQYGTTPSYGVDVPAAPGGSLGSGEGDVDANPIHLQGLLAGTVYHYRVVVISEPRPGELETFTGPDQTFTTQTVGTFALPDDRQWEMVSTPEKHGALIEPVVENNGILQASARGDAMTYTASAPTEAQPQGYSNLEQVFSTRSNDGWSSQDIGIPNNEATAPSTGEGQEYRFFSEDLSLAILQPFGGFVEQLSHEASEQTAYLRTDYLNGNVEERCAGSCFRPLVTGCPTAGQACRQPVEEHADVPPGTAFGESGQCPSRKALCGPFFVGATPDLSHILLQSDAALTLNGEPANNKPNLYEWAGGQLKFVGRGVLGDHGASARHAISDDGSRIVFAGTGLQMRDTVSEETVALDAVQGGSGSGPVQPRFRIASSDGSKVYFTDTQRLTVDSGGLENKPDLYECEIIRDASGKLHCGLTDLTTFSSGEHGDVQGVLGASEDGAYVYFVADDVLAPGAARGTCQEGASTAGARCNLYVRHDGTTRLIASLSIADSSDWSDFGTARVSPNGRWLTFMSDQDLTGEDTRDALSGSPDAEVYLYDASSDRLVCASCDPTGARPIGTNASESGASGWVASEIPAWEHFDLLDFRYQPRYLSDSGRLFFDSNDALVPQDVNGAKDVYEYEPPGVGGCLTASSTYSQRANGCVDLVSSGTSARPSVFIDASATGGDVFFVTAAKLATQDFDTAPDVYDAHECTDASPCFAPAAAQPPPCTTGDACKPPPTPQPTIFGEPASATFSGAGNIAQSPPSQAVKPRKATRAQRLAQALRACRGRRARQRAACVRRAKSLYAKRPPRKGNATKRGKG